MNTDNRISSTEAAKLLSTSTTTIRNMAAQNAISFVDVQTGKRTMRYYFKDEILAKRQSLKEYIHIADDTEKKIEEIRDRKQEIESENETLTNIKEEREYWRTERNATLDLLVQVLDLVRDGFSLQEEDTLMLKDFLSDIPIDEIARKRGTSVQTVRNRISRITSRKRNIYDIGKQLKEQKQRNEQLSAKNIELQRAVDYYENKTDESERLKTLSYDETIKQNLLLKLGEFKISIRAFNLLKGAGIDTLADLCSLDAKDITKLYGGGKKTMNEIYNILDRFGLRFGMTVSQYGIAPNLRLLKEYGKI